MATIKVPAVLADGSASSTVDVEGATLREAFENHAEANGPGLRNSVIEDGEIKEFINVYVDGREVSDLDAEIDADAKVRVIPAASGGR